MLELLSSAFKSFRTKSLRMSAHRCACHPDMVCVDVMFYWAVFVTQVVIVGNSSKIAVKSLSSCCGSKEGLGDGLEEIMP